MATSPLVPPPSPTSFDTVALSDQESSKWRIEYPPDDPWNWSPGAIASVASDDYVQTALKARVEIAGSRKVSTKGQFTLYMGDNHLLYMYVQDRQDAADLVRGLYRTVHAQFLALPEFITAVQPRQGMADWLSESEQVRRIRTLLNYVVDRELQRLPKVELLFKQTDDYYLYTMFIQLYSKLTHQKDGVPIWYQREYLVPSSCVIGSAQTRIPYFLPGRITRTLFYPSKSMIEITLSYENFQVNREEENLSVGPEGFASLGIIFPEDIGECWKYVQMKTPRPELSGGLKRSAQ